MEWNLKAFFFLYFRFIITCMGLGRETGGGAGLWTHICALGSTNPKWLNLFFVEAFDLDRCLWSGLFHSIPFHAILFYFTSIFNSCNFHHILLICYLLIHFFLRNCRKIVEKGKAKTVNWNNCGMIYLISLVLNFYKYLCCYYVYFESYEIDKRCY